ncbi:MAG: GNAT family N-acetyltransferase [Taibaiella sp.]|jgi:ElaA protein
MNWYIKSFDELNTIELYKILQLRCAVFIVEQNCPYQDLDDKDLKATHIWSSDSDGNVTAYCRILPAGISYTEPSIGRVATAATARNTGMGRILMQKAISFIHDTWNQPAIRISAQLYLDKFYTSLGFETVSEPYMEDNIPHIEMVKTN